MKLSVKYLLVLIGITLVASCKEDNLVSSHDAEKSMTVSFLLRTDADEEVKTRAISDGKSVDKLCFAVFSENGDVIVPKTWNSGISSITSAGGTSLLITLPYGKRYKAVFWAQSSQTQAYSITDDMKVSVDYTMACNDESSDAFYGVTDVFTTADGVVEVTLRRPFAQLNVGAFPFDWEYVKDFHGFDITKSSMRVRDVPHSIDLLTGKVSDKANASFKPGALPVENLLADVDNNGTPEEYTYVAMAYLLADKDASTHTAEFFFLNDKDEAVMFENESANNVQLQRNCRTDYFGQVLTNNGEINVRTYDDDGNTAGGDVYYNVSQDSTISNTIYNMSDHNTAMQFASESGQTVTYENLLFTGDIWTIELGEYRGSSYVNYNNVLNNVELRNLSVSACIECHEWYFSPACIAYGKTILNNCKMTGTTTTQTTVTDKHGVVHEVIPVDIGVRNESDAVFNGGIYGTIFAWTHAVVDLYNVIIDTLFCGTCDSTKHSWMTIGSGTSINKVICCEPRCPYGGKEYSTTMTIKSGAKVDTLQLVSTDVEFLIIEDGASVGTIMCEGVEYTYKELREAMGLAWSGL